MGTGVKGATESAASIIRREARRLRRDIQWASEAIQDHDQQGKDLRGQIERLSTEAQKLESAARLLEPDPVDQDEARAEVVAAEGAGGQTKAYAPAEKQVEKARPEQFGFMPRVRANEVYDWKNDATSIHVSGHGPNGLIFSFGVPEDDFAHIGTPKFNERIERLIDAKARCTPMDKDKL